MPPFLLYLTNCLTCPIIYNEPAEIIISSSFAFSNVYLTASSIFGIAVTSETYFSIFSLQIPDYDEIIYIEERYEYLY